MVKSGNAVKRGATFTTTIEYIMLSVTPRKNRKSKQTEPFDRMLRRFKKDVEKAGIIQECRKRGIQKI